MKYILQVFTGFQHTPGFDADSVIDRIGAVASGMKVDKVIIGWSPDAAAYRRGRSISVRLPVIRS